MQSCHLRWKVKRSLVKLRHQIKHDKAFCHPCCHKGLTAASTWRSQLCHWGEREPFGDPNPRSRRLGTLPSPLGTADASAETTAQQVSAETIEGNHERWTIWSFDPNTDLFTVCGSYEHSKVIHPGVPGGLSGRTRSAQTLHNERQRHRNRPVRVADICNAR